MDSLESWLRASEWRKQLFPGQEQPAEKLTRSAHSGSKTRAFASKSPQLMAAAIVAVAEPPHEALRNFRKGKRRLRRQVAMR